MSTDTKNKKEPIEVEGIDPKKLLELIQQKTGEEPVILAVYGSLRQNRGNTPYLSSITAQNMLNFRVGKIPFKWKEVKSSSDYYLPDSEEILDDLITKEMWKTKSFYLDTIKTEDKYEMLHLGGFPGLIHPRKDKEGTEAVIELYGTVSKGVKSAVDMLEGYRGEEYNDPSNPRANFYNKEAISTPIGEAFIYIYNNAQEGVDYRVQEDGDWNNARRGW